MQIYLRETVFLFKKGYSQNIRDEYAKRTNLNADSNELSPVP